MSKDSQQNVPAVFQVRKNKILEELSLPDAEYTDLSPKGSVDEGIRDLIRDINALPGLVTTSSCAGRISVFLEGRKKSSAPLPERTERQFAPSGGKGAGRWLYVSHDPFVKPEGSDRAVRPLHKLFGLVPGDGRPPPGSRGLRLVRFHFEPLVCSRRYLAVVPKAKPIQASSVPRLTNASDPPHYDRHSLPRPTSPSRSISLRLPRKRPAESSLSRRRGRLQPHRGSPLFRSLAGIGDRVLR